MNVVPRVFAVALLSAPLLFAPALHAGAPGQQETAQAASQPVKVTVVISRYRGETRTSNLPYSLWVHLNDSNHLRMNANVPIPTTTFTAGAGEASPVAPPLFNYQQIGTQIDCSVEAAADGRYRVLITVNDSSIVESGDGPAGLPAPPPRILSFISTNAVSLRSGETVEYLTAADKATGEVVKLTVSLEASTR